MKKAFKHQIIENVWNKDVPWGELSTIQQMTLLELYQEGDYTVVVSHPNPLVQQKIDDLVPFELSAVFYNHGHRLVLIPAVSGRMRTAPSDRDRRQIEADLAFAMICPQDVLVRVM